VTTPAEQGGILAAQEPRVTIREETRRAIASLSTPPLATAAPPASHAAAVLHRPPKAPRGTTSDLSIDETLLLHSAGWEPVDLVFGVSWWSIPWGVWQWQTGEVGEASTAFGGAFEQAAHLMADECEHAGATGVLGVEIEQRVSSHHVSITLSGTAVRRVGDQSKPKFEFLSDLSARDFVLLTRAGWWPVGLTAGASFVVAPRRSMGQWASQQGQNMELPNLTNALYLARENAMSRMQNAGRILHADGIVGVKLREGRGGANVRIMQFVAIGTGVRLVADSHRSVAPTMVVPLDERVRQFEAAKLREPKKR
jgi:uncharacterized protein YbjQ (UPF0145 family)